MTGAYAESEEPANATTDVAEDVGVERLLRLLWAFRHQGRSRTNEEIEACGYPDVTGEHSAGRRNFYNDRERLKALGVHLEETPARPSRWFVAGAPDPMTLVITAAERDALTEARILIGDDTPVTPAPAAGTAPGARPGLVPAAVPELLAAISDDKPVRFRYHDRDRFADPYRVVVTGTGRWYLLAVDRPPFPPSEKTFRIDRISEVRVDRDHTRTPCPPHARWPLHPAAWASDPPVDAVVHFAHHPLPEWVAMLGTPSAMATAADGSVDATFTVSAYQAFVRRVLAVGAHVVAPPDLVDLARVTFDAHVAAFGSA